LGFFALSADVRGFLRTGDMKTKRQSGQALVELALVLPLLLILAFGIVEFGLLMYNKAVITNASREGARVGIVAQDRSNLG